MAHRSAARFVPWIFVAWGVAAACLARAGVVSLERRFAIPAFLFGSVAALVVAYRGSSAFRAWTHALDVRWIVAFHALRAPIGVSFFVPEARGELTSAFAQPAGWGDLMVGGLALPLLATMPADTKRKRTALWLWNAFGLADIVLVVITAQRLVLFVDPRGMAGLVAFPFAMLPLFVVPLVLTSHALLFARLSQASAITSAPSSASSSTSTGASSSASTAAS